MPILFGLKPTPLRAKSIAPYIPKLKTLGFTGLFCKQKLTNSPRRIGILAERRYLRQAQPTGLIATLGAQGYDVAVLDPETALFEVGQSSWLEGLDLVVARGRSRGLLCLLAWAEVRGVPTLNRRAAIAAVHNKAEMSIVLSTANVPTPRTFLGSLAQIAGQVSKAVYPLILKPVYGDNCQGLCVVHSPDELQAISWPEPFALVQQYLDNDGYDLKLYGIGNEVWAVRKLSPLYAAAKGGEQHDADPVEVLPLTPTLCALARRCAALFGLTFYGVDCIQTPEGPVVLEVNDFPNYTGVPGASEHLADYAVQSAAGGAKFS